MNLKKRSLVFLVKSISRKISWKSFQVGDDENTQIAIYCLLFFEFATIQKNLKNKIEKTRENNRNLIFFFWADSLSKHHELMLKNKVGALVHTYIIKHRWWFFAQLRVSLSWSKASNKSSSHAQGHFTAGFTSFFFKEESPVSQFSDDDEMSVAHRPTCR